MKRILKNKESLITKNIKNTDVFGIPENYFENLNQTVNTKLFEGNLPKNPGFNTPINYFNQFEVPPPTKTTRLYYFKFIAVAASLLIGFFTYNHYKNNSNLEFSFTPEDEIIQYLSQEEFIEGKHTPNNSLTLAQHSINLNNTNDEAIIEYLDSNY